MHATEMHKARITFHDQHDELTSEAQTAANSTFPDFETELQWRIFRAGVQCGLDLAPTVGEIDPARRAQAEAAKAHYREAARLTSHFHNVVIEALELWAQQRDPERYTKVA